MAGRHLCGAVLNATEACTALHPLPCSLAYAGIPLEISGWKKV